MNVCFQYPEDMALWVYEQLKMEPPGHTPCGLGVIRDGKIIGAVAYQNQRDCDVEALAAATDPRWLSRDALRAFFGFPFNQLGCERITAMVDIRNRDGRQFVERLGFHLEGTHPCAVRDDMGLHKVLSYGILKSSCRWLNGQEKRRPGTRAA